MRVTGRAGQSVTCFERRTKTPPMYHSSIRRCSRVPCTFSPLQATAPRGVNEQKDDKRIGRGIVNSARLHQMQRTRVPAIRQMHHLSLRASPLQQKRRTVRKVLLFPTSPKNKGFARPCVLSGETPTRAPAAVKSTIDVRCLRLACVEEKNGTMH